MQCEGRGGTCVAVDDRLLWSEGKPPVRPSVAFRHLSLPPYCRRRTDRSIGRYSLRDLVHGSATHHLLAGHDVQTALRPSHSLPACNARMQSSLWTPCHSRHQCRERTRVDNICLVQEPFLEVGRLHGFKELFRDDRADCYSYVRVSFAAHNSVIQFRHALNVRQNF